MSTQKQNLTHEERTAQEPRDAKLHTVRIRSVEQINPDIRVFKLGLEENQGIRFDPGQWLDVHVPSTPKAGGFTITSPPAAALSAQDVNENVRKALEAISCKDDEGPYLELAVQRSPLNPPAVWLWQSPDAVLNQQVNIRVGGSFTWPPVGIPPETLEHAIFIAGGVGINPLISILTHLSVTDSLPRKVDVLYSTKSQPLISPQEILFLPRLTALARRHPSTVSLQWFGTGFTRGSASIEKLQTVEYEPVRLQLGRIPRWAIEKVVEGRRSKGLGGEKQVAYVCGPPVMTDTIVKWIEEMGLEGRVFFEKWW